MDNIHHNSAGRKPGQTAAVAFVAAVDPDDLIESTETAALLRVKPQTLAMWRVEKRGPRYLKVGRRCLYRRADVCAWLATQFAGGEAA